jgi:hypothetical protein
MRLCTFLALAAAVFLNLSSFADGLPDYERYEGGTKVTENALIEALAGKFAITQTSVGKRIGKNLRGTHAKGSCFKGSIELYDGLAQDGVPIATVPTTLRFANASSNIQPDFVPDVRSLSFTYTIGNKRRDFSMNNDPVFTFSHLQDFNYFMGYVMLMGSLASLPPAEIGKKRNEFFAANPIIAESVGRTGALGAKQQNKDVAHYYTETYYTGTAFLFGKNQPAKYRLDPCNGIVDRSEPLKNKVRKQGDADYQEMSAFFQNDLAKTVATAPEKICFYQSVELLDAGKMTLPEKLQPWEKVDPTLTPGAQIPAWQWVEYATLDWTEARERAKMAKPIRLAKLTATGSSMLPAAECDDIKSSFDVNTNSTPETAPIGRINRARNRVEHQSQNLRK